MRTEVHVANDPELSFSQYVPEPLPSSSSGVLSPVPFGPVVLPGAPFSGDVLTPGQSQDGVSPSTVDGEGEQEGNRQELLSDGAKTGEQGNGSSNSDIQQASQENGSNGGPRQATANDSEVNSRHSSTPVTPVRIHPPVPIVNLAGTPLDAHTASVIAQWQARWPKVGHHTLNYVIYLLVVYLFVYLFIYLFIQVF